MKPVRLKKVCSTTKSKAIIDVYWSYLKGNKDAYLSVKVVQLKKHGERIENYDKESDKFLKNFAPELYTIKKLHLSNPNGEGMHHKANFNYHFELLKKHVAKNPLTVEQVNEQLDTIKQGLEEFTHKGKSYPVLNMTIKRIGYKIVEDHYYSLFEDNYYYKSSIDRHLDYISKCYRTGAGFTSVAVFDSWVNNVKTELKKYHDLKAKITRYQTLGDKPINSSEVWTLEKFCNYYDMDQNLIKDLFFMSEEDQKAEIDKIINESVLTAKTFLDNITEKYSIPTIKG